MFEIFADVIETENQEITFTQVFSVFGTKLNIDPSPLFILEIFLQLNQSLPVINLERNTSVYIRTNSDIEVQRSNTRYEIKENICRPLKQNCLEAQLWGKRCTCWIKPCWGASLTWDWGDGSFVSKTISQSSWPISKGSGFITTLWISSSGQARV